MMKFLIPTPYEFHNKKWNPNETPNKRELQNTCNPLIILAIPGGLEPPTC